VTTPDELKNFSKRIPESDNLVRDVCDTCGFIGFQNPKLVVGVVVTADDGRFLLCKRAIEPRAGFWAIPTGYQELNETPEDGAIRETMEKANAKILIDQVLAIYSITRLSQIQIIYRVKLKGNSYSAESESTEVDLYHWADIPWEDIAFPSVHWALQQFNSLIGNDSFAPFGNP